MGFHGAVVKDGSDQDSPRGWKAKAALAVMPKFLEEWFRFMIPQTAHVFSNDHVGWATARLPPSLSRLFNSPLSREDATTEAWKLWLRLDNVRKLTNYLPLQWPIDRVKVFYVVLMVLLQEKLIQEEKNSKSEADPWGTDTTMLNTLAGQQCSRMQWCLRQVEKYAVKNLFEGPRQILMTKGTFDRIMGEEAPGSSETNFFVLQRVAAEITGKLPVYTLDRLRREIESWSSTLGDKLKKTTTLLRSENERHKERVDSLASFSSEDQRKFITFMLILDRFAPELTKNFEGIRSIAGRRFEMKFLRNREIIWEAVEKAIKEAPSLLSASDPSTPPPVEASNDQEEQMVHITGARKRKGSPPRRDHFM